MLQDRAATQEIRAAAAILEAAPVLGAGLDAMPLPVLVINRQRQIVFANRTLLDQVALADQAPLLGRRPGEILRCRTALQSGDGCGTGIACRLCGALRAVRFSQQESCRTQRECQLELDVDGRARSLVAEVTAAPLEVAGRTFTLVTLRDLGDRIRREVLERACLDQALDQAEVLHRLAVAVNQGVRQAGMDHAYRRMAADEACRLADHLRFHRQMLEAERGTLNPTITTVAVTDLVRSAIADLGPRAHRVRCEPFPERSVATDATLMRGVLSRLLLNACEASEALGEVVVSGLATELGTSIIIRNPGEVSPVLRMQLFHRICSTKDAPGHGIGTYAARLFVEELLGGRVHLDSQAGVTTVRIDLPDRRA